MTHFSLPAARSIAVAPPQTPYGVWGLRGAALTYLIAFIAVPIVVVFVQGLYSGLDEFVASLVRPDVVSAIGLSVWTAVLMTVINTVMGIIHHILAFFCGPAWFGVWSQWTTPQLAEGWIKRVLKGINPFNQRITDLYNTSINTDVSVLTQAGKRWEGDVALSLACLLYTSDAADE